MNSDYFVCRGDTMQQVIEKLSQCEIADLVKLIVNNRLNDFVGQYADYDEKEKDEHGHGKRVPYIGWFWRSIDFVGGNISIGDCGSFTGIMENNKWDYPERFLAENEVAQVVEIIWKAKSASEQGGMVNDIRKNTLDELNKLWDLLQTFEV